MFSPVNKFFSSGTAKDVNPAISPTQDEVVRRLVVGTPLFAAGGAITPFLLSKISQYSLSPLAGAIGGASLALINIATSIACKMLGIDIINTSSHRMVKTIIDLALSTFATLALCSASGISLTTISAAVLVSGSFLGCYIIALVGAINELVGKYYAQELTSFGSY